MESVDDAMKKPATKKSSANEAQAAMLVEMSMKIDKLLKYQKSVKRVAIFRGVISFIFFLVFIVLPIIAGFYLVDYVKEMYNLDSLKSFPQQLQQLQGQMQELQNLGGGFNDIDINQLLNQFGQ